MKLFWKLTAISMQGHLYYRTSFLINLLSPVILLSGQYLLWAALYAQQGGGMIGGMRKEEMFSYILFAFGLRHLINWSGENILAKEIKSGMVVARCIRPASFLMQYIAQMAGVLLLQGVLNLVIVLVGVGCFTGYLAIPSGVAVAASLPCFLLAVILRLMLTDVFSLLCFFTTGYLGISWTRAALFDFFSGAMVPVIMFPGWLKRIAVCTPFPYMLQVPLAVLLGQEPVSGMPRVLALQGFWILVFLILHGMIYGLARRNMTIAGG